MEQAAEQRDTLVHGLGELSLALLREWAPLLKPAGVGLLTTIHAWEEQNPRSPFYGWMHLAQETLAAYLDMGRTSIIRYRNLLDSCGLIEQREVSYRRPGMKLHQTVLRVSRAEVQPSLRLLEYLIFEADDWTRKHSAWLLTDFQPPRDDGELGRLVATMRRAYKVNISDSGLAVITEGERLTMAGSFAARLLQRELGSQPQLLLDKVESGWEVESEKLKVESGNSGLSIVSQMNNAERETAVEPLATPAIDDSRVSAVNNAVKDAVSPGVGGEGGIVSPGVANNANVSLSLNVKDNSNVNVGGNTDFAIAAQGARRINDEASVKWHITCLQQMGRTLYEEAIAATERVVASGKLRSTSGGYFTNTAMALAQQHGIALGKGRSLAPVTSKNSTVSPMNNAPATPLSSHEQSNVSIVNNGETSAGTPPTIIYTAPGMAARQAWQAAMAELEGRLSGLAWFGWLRHAHLLELEGNRAVIGTPSGGLAEVMTTRHANEVVEVFSTVLGRAVTVEFVTRWLSSLEAGGTVKSGVSAVNSGGTSVGADGKTRSGVPPLNNARKYLINFAQGFREIGE
ncbi:MAG: hypothetical protein DLM69_00580 [Candidatus Chloroheliales bacterium]|nr:MAG: hypothetical protein DLM69_00580 [Chloroflexota bacterium]